MAQAPAGDGATAETQFFFHRNSGAYFRRCIATQNRPAGERASAKTYAMSEDARTTVVSRKPRPPSRTGDAPCGEMGRRPLWMVELQLLAGDGRGRAIAKRWAQMSGGAPPVDEARRSGWGRDGGRDSLSTGPRRGRAPGADRAAASGSRSRCGETLLAGAVSNLDAGDPPGGRRLLGSRRTVCPRSGRTRIRRRAVPPRDRHRARERHVLGTPRHGGGRRGT
jgi:hypothetical protein